METFAQLGIPFPLFEASVNESAEYVGKSACEICGERDQHCFKLNIGDSLVVSCPNCETPNGLDANDKKDVPCRSCNTDIKFPVSSPDDGVKICYSCLRKGKGALGKDTEFGMVCWEQAVEGRTHGIPGLKTTEFETVVIDPDDDWVAIRLPKEHLFELLRTPSFHTWQGERWLFCCKKPMVYLGEWKAISAPLTSFDAKELFDELMSKEVDAEDWIWEGVSGASGNVGLYVFQCKSCGNRRVNWDMD